MRPEKVAEARIQIQPRSHTRLLPKDPLINQRLIPQLIQTPNLKVRRRDTVVLILALCTIEERHEARVVEIRLQEARDLGRDVFGGGLQDGVLAGRHGGVGEVFGSVFLWDGGRWEPADYWWRA